MISYEADTKRFDSMSASSVKCEHCGHRKVMPKIERTICDWCGRWIYKNEKAKFKYKLKNLMRCSNGK